jgi:palmitoyltransferase
VLGGEMINYTMMYETPHPQRRTRGGNGAAYQSVAGDDSV